MGIKAARLRLIFKREQNRIEQTKKDLSTLGSYITQISDY